MSGLDVVTRWKQTKSTRSTARKVLAYAKTVVETKSKSKLHSNDCQDIEHSPALWWWSLVGHLLRSTCRRVTSPIGNHTLSDTDTVCVEQVVVQGSKPHVLHMT